MKDALTIEGGPWQLSITIPDGNPQWPGADRYDLTHVDTGHSDRVVIVESVELNKEIADLREALRVAGEAINMADSLIDANGRRRDGIIVTDFFQYRDARSACNTNPLLRREVGRGKEKPRE